MVEDQVFAISVPRSIIPLRWIRIVSLILADVALIVLAWQIRRVHDGLHVCRAGKERVRTSTRGRHCIWVQVSVRY